MQISGPHPRSSKLDSGGINCVSPEFENHCPEFVLLQRCRNYARAVCLGTAVFLLIPHRGIIVSCFTDEETEILRGECDWTKSHIWGPHAQATIYWLMPTVSPVACHALSS